MQRLSDHQVRSHHPTRMNAAGLFWVPATVGCLRSSADVDRPPHRVVDPSLMSCGRLLHGTHCHPPCLVPASSSCRTKEATIARVHLQPRMADSLAWSNCSALAGSLFVVFTSDSSVQSSGFVASYMPLASFLASSRLRDSSQDTRQPERPPTILRTCIDMRAYAPGVEVCAGAFSLSAHITVPAG